MLRTRSERPSGRAPISPAAWPISRCAVISAECPISTPSSGPTTRGTWPVCRATTPMSGVPRISGRAADYYRAAGLMRRDARPGEAGHLSSPDMWYASGCAALAMKGRALLYAASPLHNALGEGGLASRRRSLWRSDRRGRGCRFRDAAQGAVDGQFHERAVHQRAVVVLFRGQYSTRNSRFYGRYGRAQCNNQNNASGICPTQNFVDRFGDHMGRSARYRGGPRRRRRSGALQRSGPLCRPRSAFRPDDSARRVESRLEKRHGQYIQEHQGDVAHHYDRQCQEFRGRVGGRPAARNHPHGLLPEQGMERRTRQHGLSPFPIR